MAALCVARLDNEEIDIANYRQLVDRLAADVAALVPAGADEAARLTALNKFFFEQSGFHGSRGEYYHRSNSYLTTCSTIAKVCRSRFRSFTWSLRGGKTCASKGLAYPAILSFAIDRAKAKVS